MPENFTRLIGELIEKPKNESEFFTIEEERKGKGLIIKLKPEKQLDRWNAADFKQQLTDQIKFRRPNKITIDLAGKDIDDEIIRAIFYAHLKIKEEYFKKNIILCRVSKGTEHKLQELGFLKDIFTINNTVNEVLDNFN